MWPIPMIIGVAVASGIASLAIGVVVAVKIERRRNRHFLQAHGLIGGLSAYHRPKLSVNEENYSNITLPTASLRRSVQLPEGVVVSNWRDTIYSHQAENPSSARHPAFEPTIASTDRKKDRIRPLSGHQIHVPKTRREKKIRKVIEMDQVHQFSLPVIDEFSDPKSGSISPAAQAPSVSQKPAKPVIERNNDDMKENRTSIQWPLPNTMSSSTVSVPTEVASIAARTSMLMRMGGISSKSVRNSQQLLSVPRSQSLTSNASSAPGDPLPPLPTIEIYHQSRNLRTRASDISLDTVGSSVLGTIMSSPSNADTDLTIPQIASDAGFSTFDFGLRHKLSTPTLQVPPGKRTIHGLVGSKLSIRSLHPSVDLDGSGHESAGTQFNPSQYISRAPHEDTLKTIDASAWENPLPLRVNKTRCIGLKAQRHSMYEPSKILEWRAGSDSVLFDTSQQALVPQTPIVKRPASVATTTFSQGQRQGMFASNRVSLTSLEGPRRGHRRQNCVRITNLPVLDSRLKQDKIPAMPQVKEEQQSLLQTRAVRFQRSPPDSQEIPNPKSTLKAQQSLLDIKTSSNLTSSPFRNRPILTPTTRPTHDLFANAPSSVSSGTPRPDSDVFNTISVQIGPSSKYANSSPRNWPLSPISPHGIRLNSTPPSAQDLEYCPSESPMLPSPAFNATSLYPRKSLVKGPRNPPASNLHYGAFSASPLQHKQRKNYRVSKDRDPSSANIDLRKSVMMLRSMNSEGRLLDDQAQRIYHSVGSTRVENSGVEPLKFSTPPMNKRISGLRNPSCNSSTIAVSPNHSGQPRGSSPLSQGQNARFNRPKPTLGSSILHSQSTHGRISESPSAVSISNVSIWEDASVRADSPEPEIPVPLTTQIRSATATVRKISPTAQRPFGLAASSAPGNGGALHVHADYNGQAIVLPKRSKTPARLPPLHDFADTENSHLVQRLERVVSNGTWDGKRNGNGTSNDPCAPGPELLLGLGLGLRVGNTRLGDPTLAPTPRALFA